MTTFGGTPNIKTLGLSISGPAAAELPLTVLGPVPDSGTMNLFTQGPEANQLTLFVGKEMDASGIVPLYLTAPMATGAAGNILIQAEATLVVEGTSYDEANNDATLAISAPSIGSGIGTSTLFVEVDAPSPDGTVPISGLMTIAVEGTNPAGVGQGQNQDTTLFIRVSEVQSGVVPLYLERPAAQSIPLSITSQISSGVLPVAISGMFTETETTTLHINAPTAKTLNTNITGYSE